GEIAAQGRSPADDGMHYTFRMDSNGDSDGEINLYYVGGESAFLEIPTGYELQTADVVEVTDPLLNHPAAPIEWFHIHYNQWDNFTYLNLHVEMPEFETADYFANGSLTVRTTAQIPDFPETAVIATVNRTQLNGGTAALTLTWADKTYRLNF